MTMLYSNLTHFLVKSTSRQTPIRYDSNSLHDMFAAPPNSITWPNGFGFAQLSRTNCMLHILQEAGAPRKASK